MSILSISKRLQQEQQNEVFLNLLANGFITVIKALLFLIFLFGLSYLIYLNQSAMKGDSLKKLKLEQSKLITENKKLNILVTQISALENISQDKIAQEMIKIERPIFIQNKNKHL